MNSAFRPHFEEGEAIKLKWTFFKWLKLAPLRGTSARHLFDRLILETLWINYAPDQRAAILQEFFANRSGDPSERRSAAKWPEVSKRFTEILGESSNFKKF